jgi:hypothetical protein
MNINDLLDYFGLSPAHFGELQFKHALEAVGIKTQVVWSADEKFLRSSTIACEPMVLGFKMFNGQVLVADSLSAIELSDSDANLLFAAISGYVVKLPLYRFLFPQTIATVDEKDLIGDILLYPLVLFFDKTNHAVPHTSLMSDIHRMEVWELSDTNSYVPGRVVEAISEGNFGYLKSINYPPSLNRKPVFQMAVPRKGIDTQSVIKLLSKTIQCRINTIVSPFLKQTANSTEPITFELFKKELNRETDQTHSQ